MKKSIVLFAFVIATMFFVSCKDEAKEATPTATTVEATKDQPAAEMHMASFACPMDCENGKTYNTAGKCPVCEMDLVENMEGH